MSLDLPVERHFSVRYDPVASGVRGLFIGLREAEGIHHLGEPAGRDMEIAVKDLGKIKRVGISAHFGNFLYGLVRFQQQVFCIRHPQGTHQLHRGAVETMLGFIDQSDIGKMDVLCNARNFDFFTEVILDILNGVSDAWVELAEGFILLLLIDIVFQNDLIQQIAIDTFHAGRTWGDPQLVEHFDQMPHVLLWNMENARLHRLKIGVLRRNIKGKLVEGDRLQHLPVQKVIGGEEKHLILFCMIRSSVDLKREASLLQKQERVPGAGAALQFKSFAVIKGIIKYKLNIHASLRSDPEPEIL